MRTEVLRDEIARVEAAITRTIRHREALTRAMARPRRWALALALCGGVPAMAGALVARAAAERAAERAAATAADRLHARRQEESAAAVARCASDRHRLARDLTSCETQLRPASCPCEPGDPLCGCDP